MTTTRRAKRYWALVGWWHGSPCAIQRGESPPPFATWMICNTKTEWDELRREGFYTRHQASRPTYLIAKAFQRGTETTVER